MFSKKPDLISQLRDSQHYASRTLADMRKTQESALSTIDKTETVMADSRRAIREANELLHRLGFANWCPL